MKINNLQTGATVVVSCMKGCKGSERIKTGKRVKVTSNLLTRSLRAGRAARLRVQETKTHFVGVWKIAVITKAHAMRTLPSPIAVYCMKPRTKSCGLKGQGAQPAVVSGNTAAAPSGGTVSITGTARENQTLTAAASGWHSSVDIAYSYQWQRSSNGSVWASISGATASTYAIASGDIGYVARVQVIATNTSAGNAGASANSAATAQITAAAPSGGTASIAGTLEENQTLTASTSGWHSSVGIGYSYQWQRSSDNASWDSISGATAATYAVTAGDIGCYLRVQVGATNTSAGNASASASSTSDAQVTAAAPSGGTASYSGTLRENQTLTASASGWHSSVGIAFSYQWQRSSDGSVWASIDGATGPTFALTSADINKYVRVQAVVANTSAGSASASAFSALTTQVEAAAPTGGTVSISGTAQDDQTLTASATGWHSSVAFSPSYQWQRSSDNTAWVSIPGATASTYVVAISDDLGYHLRVQVALTNTSAGHVSTSASSDPTASVTYAAPVNTGAPSITGTAQDGQTLSVTSNGSWTGSNISFSYYWEWCGIGAIPGATGSSFTLRTYEIGVPVGVVVTATRYGVSTSASPVCSSPVTAIPVSNTVRPSIGQTGSTLNTDGGSWSGDAPISYTFSWYRSSHTVPAQGGFGCPDEYGTGTWTYAGSGTSLSGQATGYCYAAVVTASNTSLYGGTSVTAHSGTWGKTT